MLDSDYRAWDECPEVDTCELTLALFELVDALVGDVKHLESEVIRTRYELSRYLDKATADNLRSDILSNLVMRHYDSMAYQEYIRLYYDGGNPMDFKDYNDCILNLRKGISDKRF